MHWLIQEFAEDDDDYDILLTQNVHRKRYLKYKPLQDNEEEDVKENKDAEGEEEGEDTGEQAEGEEADEVDTR